MFQSSHTTLSVYRIYKLLKITSGVICVLDRLIYRDNLKYEQYIAESDSNTFSYKAPVYIKGLRLKGQYKFSTGKDGDSVSSNIVYRTKVKIPKHSKIDGHEVMESVAVDSAFGNAGFLNYVK